MYWIYRCKGQDIPYDLYYHNYQTDRDKDGQTPLMQWIENRRGEPIPKELFYDGWQIDKDRWGHTPLMLWIRNRQGEVGTKTLAERPQSNLRLRCL